MTVSARAMSFMAPHERPLAASRKCGAKLRPADATSSSCGRKPGRLLWLLRSCLLVMVVGEQNEGCTPQDVDFGRRGARRRVTVGGAHGLDRRTGRTPQEALASR